MKQLLKEPLLHFLLIGAGLFGIYAWVNPSEEASPDQIVVSEGRIEQMISIYEKTWQRLPTEEELKALVDDYVLEEIYYRQAQEMGMDQDDTIIRRRMRQKLEFLTDEVLLAEDVDEQVLERYLTDNADVFREDARYSFEQVYINPQKHGEGLDAYLEDVRRGLRAGSEVQSDSYFVAREHSDLPAWKVDREFGQDFAEQLNGLKVDEWSEPISSGLGIHLVRHRGIITEYHIAVQVVASDRRPFITNQCRKPSWLVVLVRQRRIALPRIFYCPLAFDRSLVTRERRHDLHRSIEHHLIIATGQSFIPFPARFSFQNLLISAEQLRHQAIHFCMVGYDQKIQRTRQLRSHPMRSRDLFSACEAIRILLPDATHRACIHRHHRVQMCIPPENLSRKVSASVR
jgi:hypothetical protein